jgi:hypothetical protein
LGEISALNDIQVVDMQLHMAVKSLAILQGEIDCKLSELVEKTRLVTEKEEEGEESNYLLELILDDLNEVTELFKQRKNLRNQIENLKLNIRKLTGT